MTPQINIVPKCPGSQGAHYFQVTPGGTCCIHCGCPPLAQPFVSSTGTNTETDIKSGDY